MGTCAAESEPRPLEGVRVLAAEQFGAGPWGTMLLADLGAEIIKIENPAGGDIGRSVGPYAGDRDSVYFQSFNRSKKSVTLNLQHPQVADVLHPLVRASDVVFNNLRGDLPARLGLDYAALGPIHPPIVCCSLSAFGRTGARAAEPGYDYLMQGYAGWMSLTGEPDRPPQKAGLSLVDLSAGAMAALGTVAAVLRARGAGIGGDVEVDLFAVAVSQLAYVGAWHLTSGYQPHRMPDSSHPSQIPSQTLPTRDGWLVVMCAKEKFYQRLVAGLELPELAADPRFLSFADRLEHRAELSALLAQRTREKTTAEWLERLRGQVPCGPVNTVAEALADPELERAGLLAEWPHDQFGTVRTVGSPIRVRGQATPVRRAPALGEDTDRILMELAGFGEVELARLRTDGVI
ncbi:MAG: CoA transferase [Armatimonadetes bacterium]|nr:CoA transferase [Armatimonadota bacterium]